MRTERKVGNRCKPGEGGLGACSRGKFLKFRGSEMPFSVNKYEGKCNNKLFNLHL